MIPSLQERLDAELINQVRYGAFSDVRLLLVAGADPNTTFRIGHKKISQEKTALFFAIESKTESYRKTKELLRAGACVDATFSLTGQTPLMIALSKKRFGAVRLLVASGAHLNSVDRDGMSVLSYAIKYASPSVFKMLMDAGLPLFLSNGQGVLTEAVRLKRSDLMPLLAGVYDVKEQHWRQELSKARLEASEDPESRRILLDFWEAKKRSEEMTSMDLFSLKSDLTQEEKERLSVLLNQQTKEDLSEEQQNEILINQVKRGTATDLALLLKAGFSPLISDSFQTPLLHLILKSPQSQDKLTEVLPYLSDVNIVSSDRGKTPLMVALEEHETDIVKALVQSGADIHGVDRYQDPVVIYAARYADAECLDFLVRNGMDLSMKDHASQGVLYNAAYTKNREGLCYLLDQIKPDPQTDQDFRATRHLALRNKDVGLIRLLNGCTVSRSSSEQPTEFEKRIEGLLPEEQRRLYRLVGETDLSQKETDIHCLPDQPIKIGEQNIQSMKCRGFVSDIQRISE